VNITWHNTNLAFSWFDNSWAVWTNQSSLSLRLHDRLYLDHIQSWDTLSNAHDEIHLGFDSFEDGICCERWRNVDNRCLSVGSLLGFCDIAIDWKIQVLRSCLLLIDTSNNLGTIGNRLLSMEGSVFTSHSLYEDLGVLVNEDVGLGRISVNGSEHRVNECTIFRGDGGIVHHSSLDKS